VSHGLKPVVYNTKIYAKTGKNLSKFHTLGGNPEYEILPPSNPDETLGFDIDFLVSSYNILPFFNKI